MATELFSDLFTDPNGTLITAHSSAYTIVAGSMDIYDNGLAANFAGESSTRRNDLTPDADQYIEVTYPANLSSLGAATYMGGACRMATDGNETFIMFYVNASGRIFVVETTNGSQSVKRDESALILGGDVVRMEVSGTGANSITIYINDVLQDGTGGTTELRAIASITSGTLGFAGFGDGTTNITSASGGNLVESPSIDAIDSPVLDAESNNAFTVSTFGLDINSFIIQDNGELHPLNVSSSLSGTGNNYTWDMPDITGYIIDTIGVPLSSSYWSIKATASDGIDTASTSIIISPQTGYAVVDLISVLTTEGSVAYGWTGVPADYDQIYYPTANNTSVLSDGTLLTDQESGAITMFYFDQSDSKWKSFNIVIGITATITGTITSTINETIIVTGGATLIITLIGANFVTGTAFDANRQNILNGITSAQSETFGFNNEVRDKESVISVVRTTDQVCTITFSASAGYDITLQEIITVTVPASCLDSL